MNITLINLTPIQLRVTINGNDTTMLEGSQFSKFAGMRNISNKVITEGIINGKNNIYVTPSTGGQPNTYTLNITDDTTITISNNNIVGYSTNGDMI